MNVNIEGTEYQVKHEDIEKGDMMLINNPHPLSDMKNRVEKCGLVQEHEGQPHYQFFVVTDKQTGNGHWSNMYPKSMCKKVVPV